MICDWMRHELKCPEKTNVCEFLDNLHVKKEELATYGVDIEEKDYHSTIFKSLPPLLEILIGTCLPCVTMVMN